MRKPHILVSGEAGHGKDSVGSYLVDNHGYLRTAFGDPLKEEVFAAYANAPQKVHWETVNAREIKEVPLHRLSLNHCSDGKFQRIALKNFDAEDAKLLPYFRDAIDCLDPVNRRSLTLLTHPTEAFYGMSNLSESDRLDLPRSFRRICQLWGTEHRREESENYWVDQIDAFVDASDQPVVITDGRFANECDWADKRNIRRINVTRPISSMATSSDEMKIKALEADFVNRMNNWVSAPGIETLMQLVHAKIALSANRQQKHASEMIPPVDERAADLHNDGTLMQLYEKTEDALLKFVNEARPRLAL